MKKKIWIGLGIVLMLFVIFEIYQFATTRSHSPEETVSVKSDELDISVTYCRPYKKERLIFGEEDMNALVPFGKYWRLGANDATEISFSSDVLFGGEKVLSGTYRMYAVPFKDYWEVSLNSELGQFGYFEPDYDLDVAKIKAPVHQNSEMAEQFTIKLEQNQEEIKLYLIWDKTVVFIPIQSI